MSWTQCSSCPKLGIIRPTPRPCGVVQQCVQPSHCIIQSSSSDFKPIVLNESNTQSMPLTVLQKDDLYILLYYLVKVARRTADSPTLKTNPSIDEDINLFALIRRLKSETRAYDSRQSHRTSIKCLEAHCLRVTCILAIASMVTWMIEKDAMLLGSSVGSAALSHVISPMIPNLPPVTIVGIAQVNIVVAVVHYVFCFLYDFSVNSTFELLTSHGDSLLQYLNLFYVSLWLCGVGWTALHLTPQGFRVAIIDPRLSHQTLVALIVPLLLVCFTFGLPWNTLRICLGFVADTFLLTPAVIALEAACLLLRRILQPRPHFLTAASWLCLVIYIGAKLSNVDTRWWSAVQLPIHIAALCSRGN